MDGVERRLLDNSIDLEECDKPKHPNEYKETIQQRTPNVRRQFCWQICLFTISQLALIILYTFVFLIMRQDYSNNHSQIYSSKISSPAQDAIQYEQRYFEKYGHITSPYSGAPSSALDDAWHRLLEGMNIRVSEDVLRPYNTTSVRLSDGSGYIAQLGVYHELHCLKRLKHWIYKDQYHPNLTADELFEGLQHIEHCLEWIRVAALCRSDTTLTTFAWATTGNRPPRLETEYPIPHQCVNADHLLAWSRKHAVDINVPGVLQRPGQGD